MVQADFFLFQFVTGLILEETMYPIQTQKIQLDYLCNWEKYNYLMNKDMQYNLWIYTVINFTDILSRPVLHCSYSQTPL